MVVSVCNRMTNPYTLSHMNELSEKNLFSVISTFAGGGGSSIGYKLAGANVALANERLSNLTSGLLDLCRSVILAFPFNIRFFSTGPLVVDFDEHGANQAFEWFCVWKDADFAGPSFQLLLDAARDGV